MLAKNTVTRVALKHSIEGKIFLMGRALSNSPGHQVDEEEDA